MTRGYVLAGLQALGWFVGLSVLFGRETALILTPCGLIGAIALVRRVDGSA